MNKKNVKKFILAFLLLSGLFFAQSLFAQTDFGTGAVSDGLNGTLATGDPRTIATRIINIALGFLGLIAVGIILYAGFKWMTSNGEEDKITDAKNTLKNGVIGLVIVLASWGIATFVINKLSGAIGPGPNPGKCIESATSPCQCGGSMVCTNGSWGSCIGGNLSDCPSPKTCNSNALGSTCQPVNQICSVGYFCDNSCLCQKQGDADTSCDSNLNNSTCDTDNNRCSEYTTCDPGSCTCVGSPVITGLSPVGGFCDNNINQACLVDENCGAGDTCNLKIANGTTNNFITIFGKNFGEYSEGASQIIFLGKNNSTPGVLPVTINPACVDSWRDNQIIIAVPAGVQAGPIQVITGDNLGDKTDDDYGPEIDDFVANNISRPGLCSLNPAAGVLSSEVNYQGANLYSGTAYFGNYESNISALYSTFSDASGLTGTSTIPNIRAGESGSFVEREINGFKQKSNYLEFTKEPDENSGPYITSFSPVEGNAGQYLTIRGAGFGGARGNNNVYFVSGSNRIEASYSFPSICANSIWSDNQIIVRVPEMADDNYKLQIALGEITISTQNLNPNSFKFDKNAPLKPSLCKMSPEQGSADTPVTLWGEYFGQKNHDGLIKFNYQQNATGIIDEENNAQIITTNVPLAASTGLVKVVIPAGEGNGLNFSVGECTKNEECDNKICCPQNTYKKGRCVANINECFADVPTSVFEWGFSTSLATGTTLTFDSCLGLSKYLGSCFQGASCPNSPGACSSPSTSYQKTVGICDRSCEGISGCNNSACNYDEEIDKCVKKKTSENGICDQPQKITFVPSDYSINTLKESYTTEKICTSFSASSSKWEIVSASSCPIGWTRLAGDKCIQNNSNCGLCGDGFTCENVNSENRCVSDKLCTDKDAKCIDNPIISEADKCTINVDPGCECCCRIGYAAQDCCSGLTCAGKCGADITNDSKTYGSCSGCAKIGTTADEHDAGCNCTGHGSQYCEIDNENPGGICTDCSGLEDQADCGDHSSACCFDSNKTAATTDDYCRGVNGSSIVNSNKSSNDYGYCAYYQCQSLPNDPYECASTTPVRVGFFNKVDTCVSDCPNGDIDPCSVFNDKQEACSGENKCCYDKTTSKCKTGNQIIGGGSNDYSGNKGYCAYYDCQTPLGNPLLCDITSPTTTPIYISTSTCTTECAKLPKGPGVACDDKTGVDLECNFDVCNASGFACLQEDGKGGSSSNCGTCCCTPETASTTDSCVGIKTPNLHCQADTGSCTGASRGLCCGCSKDSDCGSILTVGCGASTCCQARPKVVITSPVNSATNVCRNAAIEITFDQKMNVASLNDNFLLFEEMTYGEGVCSPGTFLADSRMIEELINPPNKNVFVRLWERINLGISHLFGRPNGQVLAESLNSNKLYCTVPGTVSANENGLQTVLIFNPAKILSPATKYYALVKGDESLNSQTGVMSSVGIGMSSNDYNPSNQLKFNKSVYPNAYSFQFRTLSNQGLNAGICAVDYINVRPESYLFKTTVNDLNEKDNDVEADNFDTVSDGDKVFTAGAYSTDGQSLKPVIGYAWNWNWSVDDASVVNISNINGLVANKSFVSAEAGITDSETKLRATVNMDDFRPGASCGTACNALFAGDKEYDTGDIYVFVCTNPWPAVKTNNEWSPWSDKLDNCLGGSGSCESYNYKFYYCRDAGAAGTLDDLPAISNAPVSKGMSLICSSDQTACSTANEVCGANNSGVCFWNILKESYFFRETVLSGVNISKVIDTERGGEVRLNWQSSADKVLAYKIYYLRSGKGSMMTYEVKATDVCESKNGTNDCTATISGLINNQLYIFKLTVISTNKTESALSGEKMASSTDKIAPSVPTGLTTPKAVGFQNIFSWKANTDDTVSYRLYRGVLPGKYVESFSSAGREASLSLPISQFSNGVYYFALSAIDSSGNESRKSTEVQYTHIQFETE